MLTYFQGAILGALIHKIKHVQYQLIVGIAVQTLFTALFALITPDTIPMALVFQCLANIPFAWITLNCYITASLHVPQRDLGLALGLIGTFRFLVCLTSQGIFLAESSWRSLGPSFETCADPRNLTGRRNWYDNLRDHTKQQVCNLDPVPGHGSGGSSWLPDCQDTGSHHRHLSRHNIHPV